MNNSHTINQLHGSINIIYILILILSLICFIIHTNIRIKVLFNEFHISPNITNLKSHSAHSNTLTIATPMSSLGGNLRNGSAPEWQNHFAK